jgi:hypothetical protein
MWVQIEMSLRSNISAYLWYCKIVRVYIYLIISFWFHWSDVAPTIGLYSGDQYIEFRKLELSETSLSFSKRFLRHSHLRPTDTYIFLPPILHYVYPSDGNIPTSNTSGLRLAVLISQAQVMCTSDTLFDIE